MKKVSTEELITAELENYLEGVLTCCDFDNSNLDRYVTGRALELLEKLPENERPRAISEALGTVDYGCINAFPYPQDDDEFLLPFTEFEIDITNAALESPDDFCITTGTGDCKLAYYAINYGAYIPLDLNKLEAYVSAYLTENK